MFSTLFLQVVFVSTSLNRAMSSNAASDTKAEGDGQDVQDGGTEIMSKRQKKKLLKQQQWEEQRDLRK